MPSKEFLCKKCGDVRKRPINSKCPFGSPQSVEFDSENVTVPGVSGVAVQSDDSNALNVQILAELKSLGGRMTAMEDRMAKSEQQEVEQRSNASGTQAAVASTSDSSRLEQVVVPFYTLFKQNAGLLRSHFGKEQIQLDINFHRDLKW